MIPKELGEGARLLFFSGRVVEDEARIGVSSFDLLTFLSFSERDSGRNVPMGPMARPSPRLEMKDRFAETCRRLVAAKPETRYDNFLRDFGERFVPGDRPVSSVDLLMNAPFEE